MSDTVRPDKICVELCVLPPPCVSQPVLGETTGGALQVSMREIHSVGGSCGWGDSVTGG